MPTLRRLLFLGGLLAAAGLSTGAHADPIQGSQQFLGNVTTIIPADAALNSITKFTVVQSTLVNSPPAPPPPTIQNQSGDFAGLGPFTLNGSTLDTNDLDHYTFGSVGFGTFVATTGSSLTNTPTQRSFSFDGTFTPGTGLSPYTANDHAQFTISLTQTGGAGTAISWSATLYAPAVPELPSMSIAAVPALLGLIALRRRTRKVIA